MKKNPVLIGCAAALLALGACAAPAEDEATSPAEGTSLETTLWPDYPEPEEEPDVEFTEAQEKAFDSATEHLLRSAFSKAALIEQLISEGFDKADAEMIVEEVDVSWNEQAVLAAKQYLETSPMSRDALIEHLINEKGFTKKRAIYAADKLDL